MSSAEASDIIDKIMAETANPLTLSINAKKWGVAYKSTADAIIKETRDKASNLVYNKPVAR